MNMVRITIVRSILLFLVIVLLSCSKNKLEQGKNITKEIYEVSVEFKQEKISMDESVAKIMKLKKKFDELELSEEQKKVIADYGKKLRAEKNNKH